MEGLVAPIRECQDHWGQVRALFVYPLHRTTHVSIWDRPHLQVAAECSIGAWPRAHSFRRCDILPIRTCEPGHDGYVLCRPVRTRDDSRGIS